ncbi:hypothetical protein ACUNWD_18220 [Sunxiuqinia sp. A32]|uniref:hypothetical protein n=1 Tax=Sunxiuqinia sp. A32 TaxID=3461496 RepID=UPI0040462A69
MNVKRFLLASLAVFVTFQLLDFIIHGVILMSTYEETASVWREDMMDLMWIMYISGVLLSLLFVYIYIKGFQNKGIMEGVRYGLVMWLLLMVVGSVNQFVIYPVPADLAVKWIIYGLVELVVAGVVTALVYKPKS